MKKAKKAVGKKTNKKKVKANNVTIVVNNNTASKKAKKATKKAPAKKAKPATAVAVKIDYLAKYEEAYQALQNTSVMLEQEKLKTAELGKTIEQTQNQLVEEKARKSAEINGLNNQMSIAIDIIDVLLTKIEKYKTALAKYHKKRLFKEVLIDYNENVLPKVKEILTQKLGVEFEDEQANSQENSQTETETNSVQKDLGPDDVEKQLADNELNELQEAIEEDVAEPETIAEETIDNDIENDLNL